LFRRREGNVPKNHCHDSEKDAPGEEQVMYCNDSFVMCIILFVYSARLYFRQEKSGDSAFSANAWTIFMLRIKTSMNWDRIQR